jgi:hypothetical protein
MIFPDPDPDKSFGSDQNRIRIRIHTIVGNKGTRADILLNSNKQNRPLNHRVMDLVYFSTYSIPEKKKNRTSVGDKNRVLDPYSFFPDPDPAFEAGDQYGSGSNPDPGGFNDKKFKINFS